MEAAYAASFHSSATCEKVKKNAISLANTNRDMNNSPRRKTMRDLKNLKFIPMKHQIL